MYAVKKITKDEFEAEKSRLISLAENQMHDLQRYLDVIELSNAKRGTFFSTHFINETIRRCRQMHQLLKNTDFEFYLDYGQLKPLPNADSEYGNLSEFMTSSYNFLKAEGVITNGIYKMLNDNIFKKTRKR